jgi:hypothetical protein
MKLLIDADQIGRLAETFRGVSANLLSAAQTVRNDAWATELNSNDAKVKVATPTETTTRVATKFQTHAGTLESQSQELRKVEELVRGDHVEQCSLKKVPPSTWRPVRVCTMPPLVTVQKRSVRSLTDGIVGVDPIEVAPRAVSSLRTVTNWSVPTSSGLVDQVQAALPEEILPTKPKKKKGLFGRIFSAIGSFFKKLWNAVKSIAKKLWKVLQNTLVGIWNALKHMSFKQLLLLAGTLALQFIPGLGQAAAGALFGAANAARVVTIASTAYRVVSAGRAIYQVAAHGIHGLGDILSIAGSASGVLRGIGQVGGSIGRFASTAGAHLESAVNWVSGGGMFTAVSRTLGGIVTRFVDFIGGIVPKTGPLADVFRTIGRTGRDVIAWIKDKVRAVGKIFTDARDWVNKTIGDLKAKFRSVVDGIADSLGQHNTELRSFLHTLVDQSIVEGRLTIHSLWTDIRTIVSDGIKQAVAIVTPVGQLVAGNYAGFIQGTLTGIAQRSTIWTGPRVADDGSLSDRITPVTDWNSTGDETIETIRDATTTVEPSANVDATDPQTIDAPTASDTETAVPTAPNVSDESPDVQVSPETGTQHVPTPVTETATPVDVDVDVVDTDTTETETTAPTAPLNNDVIVVEPASKDSSASPIMPASSASSTSKDLDGLRNNLNVIVPTGAKAAVWNSPVPSMQSSTVQGLLGLVDPTNDLSSTTRELIAA